MLPAVDRPLHRLAPGAALASIVLAAHAVLAFVVRPRPGMILWTDGAGYLANARWLAPGVEAPYLDITPFYHAGYSLLIAPLLLVTTDPDVVFTGFLVVNVVAAVVGALLLWRLALGAFGLGPWPAALAAAAGSLYPAVLLQAGYEWAESLLFALVAAWALTLWRLLAAPAARAATGAEVGQPATGGTPDRAATGGTAGRAVAHGAVAVAAFAVHGRAASLLAVTAGVLLAGAVVRRFAPAVALAAGAVLVAGTALTTVVHEVIRTTTRAPEAPGAGAGLGARLLDPSLWGEIALRAAGQTWYVLAATLLLAGVGVAVLGGWLLDRAGSRSWFAGALLAALAVTVAVGAAGPIDPRRVDHHVYGRYLEMLAPLLLVAAVAGVLSVSTRLSGRPTWRQWTTRRAMTALAVSAAMTAALGAAVRLGYGADAFTGDLMPLNVLGILVWSTDRSTIDPVAVTGGVLAGGALIGVAAVAARRVPWLPVLAVLAVFAGSAAIVDDRTLEPFTEGFRRLSTLPDAVRAVQEAAGGEDPLDVAYDLADRDSFVANAYVSDLLEHRFRPFDADRGEQPPAELVIGAKDWAERHDPDAALVYPETHRNQALWVRPGPVQDALRQRGLVVASSVEDLPASFFAAELAEVDTPHGGDGGATSVRVVHAGGGAPWVRFGVLTGVPTVRLGVRWYPTTDAGDGAAGDEDTDGDDAAPGAAPQPPLTTTFVDLPRTLLPGWAASLPLALDPVDAAGGPLIPGVYRIRIGLVVGDVWFADRGGPEITRTVRLGAGPPGDRGP